MQLNWLYFCGICQRMPLKVWPNTALGCNHQSICMPQLQPLCSTALVPNVLPKRTKAWVSPVQWSKPHSILPLLRILTQLAGFKIISGDHYTTTAHINTSVSREQCGSSVWVSLLKIVQIQYCEHWISSWSNKTWSFKWKIQALENQFKCLKSITYLNIKKKCQALGRHRPFMGAELH